MIRIGRFILEPNYARQPHYRGGLDSQDIPAIHTWPCIACQSALSMRLNDPRVFQSLDLGEDDEKKVKEVFEIGVVGRSKDGGWPTFHNISCLECGQKHLVYLGVQEPSNSQFLVTVQAICELTFLY